MPWVGPVAGSTGAGRGRLVTQVQAARARSRGGLCVDLGAAVPADLAAWCAALRHERLVPMLRVPADRLDGALLATLEAAAPLLVCLAPTPGGLGCVAQMRGRLADLRSPLLRFADMGLPVCHRGPWQPDVLVVAPSAPRRPVDARCVACGAVAGCAGPVAPDDPVRPLPAAVSNQFDVTLSDQSNAFKSACPQEGQGLLLPLDGHRPQLFSMPTERTRAAGVRQALQRGQLYLDLSEKARIDDFASELALLRPVHAPHRTGSGWCIGVWQRAQEQPFAAEEAELRAVLATLSGTVIDVGSGPIHYLRELHKAMQEGILRYIAVEPDRDALLAARRALPQGTHIQGTGEHLPLRSATVDAVMMLRSFNHLRDPAAALREASRVLRPHGLLVLVDNVLFGLVRSAAQRRRAHAIPVSQTPFEHYRNAAAREAVAMLREATDGQFIVERTTDVEPGRSNQWLVVARRSGHASGPDS